MNRSGWLLVGLLVVVAHVALRWLLEILAVPRNPAAAVAGVAVLAVGIAIILPLDRRRGNGTRE